MKRAALYARYSTDLQSPRSADDQIRLCRDFASQHGFTVVLEEKDEGKSGATIFGRDGLQRVLAASRKRAFDALIIESVDRLSRDVGDGAVIYKELEFHEAVLFAVDQGAHPVDKLSFTLHNAVGEVSRKTTTDKIRRGMSKRIEDGLHMGGKAYGFRKDESQTGGLIII
jgi:site-specific DNA recombinase